MENTQRDYKYDVALSFAGEDREFVDKVANIIKNEGVIVFYDEFAKVETWGKNLPVKFDKIYSIESQYVIIFISKSYKEKAWTNFELSSALQKAVKQKTEYILPARFDDTELDGLNDNIAFIDLC
jgi:hypothetical protein